MRQKVKVSMYAAIKPLYLAIFYLCMHADLENGNIAENSNGKYVWIMNTVIV